MKTDNLFEKFDELESFKEDVKSRMQAIETAEHNLEELLKESFKLEIIPAFNKLVEKREWDKVREIIQYLNSTLIAFKKDIIKLKCNSPKKGFPKVTKVDFIKDKKFFDEVLKFGKSFLSKEAFERITSGIEWDSKEKVVKGSKPEFIVLLNDFDKQNSEECKTLTAHTLWKFNEIFKDNLFVDNGFYLNGSKINSEFAKNFISQFEELGLAKKAPLHEVVLNMPIKIDLFGLTFKKSKEGSIYLTKDESVYTQTEAFQNENYCFEEVDEYGINIPSYSGNINYVPGNTGMFRCYFVGNLDSYARSEDLSNSGPFGRVVRKIA